MTPAFHRRSATNHAGVIALRGLKPTATSISRSATGSEIASRGSGPAERDFNGVSSASRCLSRSDRATLKETCETVVRLGVVSEQWGQRQRFRRGFGECNGLAFPLVRLHQPASDPHTRPLEIGLLMWPDPAIVDTGDVQ